MPVFAAAYLPALAISLFISIATYALQVALAPRPQVPRRPEAPKPDDGKFNLKQMVPSLTVVLGRVKKGGDYVWLVEKGGTAYHVMVLAGHRIEGFVEHWLHDEPVELDGILVSSPAHFRDKVRIRTRVGADAVTPYAPLVETFPETWTEDHRGDGLASVLMTCSGTGEAAFLDVYPHQMPVHTAVMDGARLYDPRTGAAAFSRNIALFRLFHLTHPSGGKLSLDDLYMPDWATAAAICDAAVVNRAGEEEPRYHGGYWYRFENDPVEVGRLIDEAGELVVYERADGRVGVHAGRYVEPDIRIAENDLLSLRVDVNARRATNVLAVRGRFTAPDAGYNTFDAAIFGDPYPLADDTQRTVTVDNPVVQSHNHVQRLQKLRMIRANAMRVAVSVAWQGLMRQIPYRRFVRVHYPSRGLDEAVVEIVGRPQFSLKDLTLSFDAIVVPATLYDFDAATEEGEPPSAASDVAGGEVPMPEGFAVEIGAIVVGELVGGVYAVASWTLVDAELQYELQWQRADLSAPPRSVASGAGETSVASDVLEEGVEYRFALRTVTNGAHSDWTDDIEREAVPSTAAPAAPQGFSSSLAGGVVTLSWQQPASLNFWKTEILRSDAGPATVIATVYGGRGQARSYDDVPPYSATWSYWLRAVNEAGGAAALEGPQTQIT